MSLTRPRRGAASTRSRTAPGRCLPPAALARAFPPVAAATAHSLILGSLPGQASLAARRYYAHPRNAFWPIMRAVLGLPPQAGYERCCAALCAAGFALWDVLAQGERPGSLDANIRTDTVRINDFAAFFAAHPQLQRVFFNGVTAERLFLRHVLPELGSAAAGWLLQRLPSTSPAHASLSLEEKQRQWRAALLLG